MITSWKNISLLTYLLLALMTASCQSSTNQQDAEGGFQDLSVAEFQQTMAAGNVVVLDVRTPAETSKGVIKGAKELDFRAEDFREQLTKLDNNKTYLVYCQSGGRSSSACSMMEEMGFKNVYNLVGGYKAWSAEK